MNEIIEVLQDLYSPNSIEYEYIFDDKKHLVIYLNGFRYYINKYTISLYKLDHENNIYDLIYQKDSGLDIDEYFNLLVQHEMIDICLKKNVDILRSTMDNLIQGLHILRLGNL